MAVQQYLTFNKGLGTDSFGIPEDDTGDVLEALKEPVILKDSWWLWEQVVKDGNAKSSDYADATRKVCEFKTIQDFWGIWNGLPQPSELLEQKRIMRDQHGQSVAIDAFMIFKDDIKPEWEHPQNKNGGHIQVQLKPQVGGGQIDEYWNNVVLGVVGGTLEPSDMITGIRLVDKLSGPKAPNAIRIELWFSNWADNKRVKQLQSNFDKCMCMRLDGSQSTPPKAELKPHSAMGKH